MSVIIFRCSEGNLFSRDLISPAMYSAQNVKGLQRSARQAFPDPITACNNNYALQYIVYWTERENKTNIRKYPAVDRYASHGNMHSQWVEHAFFNKLILKKQNYFQDRPILLFICFCLRVCLSLNFCPGPHRLKVGTRFCVIEVIKGESGRGDQHEVMRLCLDSLLLAAVLILFWRLKPPFCCYTRDWNDQCYLGFTRR